MKKPTLATARKINELLNHGLCKGLGKPEPGKMCVEAAVCYALGQDHSDSPECVGEAVRSFKIALNDANWSSNIARADGLREIAIAQLGSNTINQRKFADIVVLENIRQILPLILNAAKLYDVANKCRAANSLKEAEDAARDAARYAANAAWDAANAAWDAASAAWSAAESAANAAWYAARYAARSAANAARYAAESAANAARGAASDKILCLAAKIGVDALRQLDCPGVKFLSVIKKENEK